MAKRRNENGRFYSGAWDDDAVVEKLKQLWSDGHSASEIAKQLDCFRHCADGGRSAVLGKAHRLGLSLRGYRPGGIIAKRNAGLVPRKPRPKLAPKPLSPAAKVIKAIRRDGLPLPEPSEIDVARVSVFEVEPHHCRWVATSTETDNHGNPLVFCGGKKAPGLPYCAPHVARAYNSPDPNRPAQPFRLQQLQVA